MPNQLQHSITLAKAPGQEQFTTLSNLLETLMPSLAYTNLQELDRENWVYNQATINEHTFQYFDDTFYNVILPDLLNKGPYPLTIKFQVDPGCRNYCRYILRYPFDSNKPFTHEQVRNFLIQKCL